VLTVESVALFLLVVLLEKVVIRWNRR
jgi:hypothetical protein